MQYYRKPKTVDAIIYNGMNINEIKGFLKEKYKYGHIMENGRLSLLLNDNNDSYSASINDYIVVDKTHGFTMTKEAFENTYIPQS